MNEFYQLVQRLHLKWLNRRSQRQSYNWAGYRVLKQHFTLERPRINARRQPVCRWHFLRKRVFTKSPVRENCTPGSVRGPSGDWQSYRDPFPETPAVLVGFLVYSPFRSGAKVFADK